MTATAPAAALVPIRWASPTPNGSRLEGFRAGYSGLAREAHALDLRQLTSWCRARSRPLSAASRGLAARGSGRRREELQGNSVRVAEGDPDP